MGVRSEVLPAKLARALLLGATACIAVAAPAAAQDGGGRFPFLRGLQDIPLPIPQLPGFSGPPQAQPPPPTAPEQPDGGAQPPGTDPAAAEPKDVPQPEAAGTEASGPDQSAQPPEQAAAPEDPAGSGATGADASPDAAEAPEPTPGPSEAAGPSEAVSSYSLRALRLGVLAGRDVGATMAALDPVTQGLGEALGRSVEILPMASYRAMIDAQESQRIDGGFYSAAAYALAEAQCRCLEPIIAPAAADGTAAYYAIIVAAPESGIASIPDLAGKTVAVGAADSVGARRMQIAALASEGFDLSATAASVVETASPHEAVRLVAQGEADAAFAWSSLEGELETGYSRGTLTDLVASGDILMDEVAVIWRSPAIAHGPLAVAKALPEEDKRRVETFLVGLSAAAPMAYDALNPFYPGGYVAVEPDDYRGLEALAAADADPARPAGDRPATEGSGAP